MSPRPSILPNSASPHRKTIVKKMAGVSLAPHLEALLDTLKQPDAILHPEIKSVLAEYVRDGGDLAAGLDALFSGYCGVPHMIDIVGSILQELGIDCRDKIYGEIHARLVDELGRQGLEKLDEFMMQPEPPSWIKSMLESEMWVDFLVTLPDELKCHRSPFLWFCLNRIAKEKPRKIRHLPAGCLQYNAYLPVLTSLIEDLKDRKRKVEDFIKLISTDALTLSHAAFVCYTMDNNRKVKAFLEIDKLITDDSKRSLFRSMILALDGCDTAMRKVLVNNDAMTPALMEQLISKAKTSPFVKHLITTKIKRDLFNEERMEGNEEVLRSSIRFLANLQDEELEGDDEKFLVEAVEKAKNLKSTPKERTAAIVMRALKKRCFVDAWFPRGLEALKDPNLEQKWLVMQMLYETAYYHRHLASAIAERALELLPEAQKPNTLLDLLWYVMRRESDNDASVQILEKFLAIDRKSQICNRHPSEIRSFFTNILSAIEPPFSTDFIIVMVDCLNQMQSVLIPPDPTYRRIKAIGNVIHYVYVFCSAVKSHGDPLPDHTLSTLRDLEDKSAP